MARVESLPFALPANTSPTMLAAFAAAIVIIAAWHILRKRDEWPKLSNPPGQDLRACLRRGTQLYPNGVFEIPTAYKRTLILPRKFIEEIKALPDSRLSFRLDVIDRLVGTVTLIGTHEKSMIDAVKFNLTKNIGLVQMDLQDEARHAVERHIGACSDWTSIPLFPKLLHIIALMSGRVFVGLPLSRNEEWLHSMIHYTEDAFAGATKLWPYHPIFQPLVALWQPEIRRTRAYVAAAEKLIRPVLEQRLNDMQSPDFKSPHDMIQYMLANAPQQANKARFQAKHQILAQFTAMHTTTMNACHAVYELAAHPHHLPSLREELTRVLAAEGGVLTKSALSKMKKLDSFFRETQRVNPANLLGMGRKVTSTFQLSDGTVLRKGSYIAFDAQNINHDEKLWPNPDDFDGFRFERLRQDSQSVNRFQAVTTGPDNLAFGHGVHACPGRFFAVNETKVLLAHLILNYDWQYVKGQGRPDNFFIDTMIAPNPTVEMLFKARQRE